MANKKRLKKPFVPGSPVTYGQVLKDRDAEVALRYGPAQNALQARQVNTTNWFDQYKADLAAQGQAQAQQYQAAVQGVNAQAAQSRQAAEAQRARLDAEMRADAASRGAAYSGLPGVQSSGGADVRQGLSQLFGNLVQSQGLTYGARTADQIGVGGAAQLSERFRGQKALEELAREKGLFGTQYMSQRRDAENKSVLERLLFGQDVAESQIAAADKAADNRRENKKFKSAQEKDAYQRAHGLGPYKPAAQPKPDIPKPDVKVKATIRKAVRAVKQRDNGLPTYWGDAYSTLVDIDGLDPAVARAVVQGARYGRLGAKTKATLLKDYGITARSLGFTKPKPRQKPYPVNTQSGNSDPHYGGEG